MIPFNVAKGLRVGDRVHVKDDLDGECYEAVVEEELRPGHDAHADGPCQWWWIVLEVTNEATDNSPYLYFLSTEPINGQHYLLGVHLPTACDGPWGRAEPEMAEAYARLGAPEGDPCLD